VNRADRERWASARTLADLGELTALWLEGEIRKAPGYDGPPDPETLPLVPVLAAACRAGFVTSGSQPGCRGAGQEQRAAVEGFASLPTMDRLLRCRDGVLAERGLPIVIRAWRASWRTSWRYAIPVSRSDGQVVTRFGARLSRRFIRDPWTGYGACHRDAVAALCGAWQVTVTDPQWGRDDALWPVPAKFAALPQEAQS